MKSKTDEELIELIVQNYRPALEELYERYVKLIYSFSLKMANGDPEETKEIVQQVFLKLWTTKRTYNPAQGKFPSWLLTITRNTAIDYIRKKERQPKSIQLEDKEWADMRDRHTEDVPQQVSRGFLKQEIQAAKRQLSEPHQRLLNLLYWQGYTLSEIAELEKTPVGTIKSRLNQALKKMRYFFEEETGGARHGK